MGATPGYLRQPTICGDELVFVCEDDLWWAPAEGGQAVRLTASVGPMQGPRFAPDGRSVAFTGTDDGPQEVYLLELAGGPPRRLTHQAAQRCSVVGWHPDTGEVLYASDAHQLPDFGPRLFAVDPAGGEPRLLPYGSATVLAHGPGGALVLGRNTGDPARWKRYRGGAAGELWTTDDGGAAGVVRDRAVDRPAASQGRRFRPLVELPGNLAAPCWAAGRVWFLSDHEGVGNVYSCAADGTDLTRHTHHRDFYARALHSDGTRLVHQVGAELMLLDPAGGGPRRIDLVTHRTGARRRRTVVSAAQHLEHAHPSPDGARTALVVRGQVCTLGHWEGPARMHGVRDGARYRLPAWLPDGRRLAVVLADECPDERLVLLDTAVHGPPSELELPDLGRALELEASPTADTIAVANHRHELYAVDLPADGPPTVRQLDHSPYAPITGLAWSPDGRWLAYTLPTGPQTSAVKLADLATGECHQITEPVLRDHSPCFDPEGRFLYFLGQRRLSPVQDPVTRGFGFPHASHPYLLTLHADQPSPFVVRPSAPGEEPEPPLRTAHEEDSGIDLAGISGRVVAFPVPSGEYLAVLGTPSGALLLTASEQDSEGAELVFFDLTALELRPVADAVSEPRLNAAGDTLLYRSGDRLRALPAECAARDRELDEEDAPGPGAGWVDLGRVCPSVLPEAEWRQLFREVWRLQRDHFWEPATGGVDWAAVYRRYLPLLDRVGTRAELSDLLWEMQAELGTSHAYEFSGTAGLDRRPGQGFLGVDWVPGHGSARIAHVLTGDPGHHTTAVPVRRLGVDIRPGDVVTAVDGRPVGPPGVGPLLAGRAGQEIELTLRRDGAERRVRVRAGADERPARYLDWVRARRDEVRERTGGRVGYVHIPDLYADGYAAFVRGFLAEHDRAALIVDARFNPGGFTSPLVLDRLARRREGYEHSRWEGALPCPVQSPRGPLIALVNEHTGSDGEVFAHLFRARGLGPIVGRRTWGGVIATHPRHPLVDGTLTTQPEYAYTFTDVGQSLENHGIEPDISVDDAPYGRTHGIPSGHGAGDDVQLARAIRVALEALEDRSR
ncbi:S41 family peptidase [Streptomyces sp. NPDC051684]|uniref:S41 family peptidase n=1 Tax=Streptomyces sp. NPDC051684 TaxID=3365670 RepID=UPI0037B43752